MDAAKPPSFDNRLSSVRLPVWENETEGRRWYTAAPSKRFVDATTQEVKYTSKFSGVADLVLLRELINRAIAWIESRGERSEEE
jgi:hypothetical protein